MIREWNNEIKDFEVIDNSRFENIEKITQHRNIRNLCIRIGSFSLIGATLCSMEYISSKDFSAGLGITIFGFITLGSAVNGFTNYVNEKRLEKTFKK